MDAATTEQGDAGDMAGETTTGGAVATTGGSSGSPLTSDRGTTTIADSVVTKIAGIAAREVAGVHALGGGVGRALSSVTSRVGGGGPSAQGVSVEVGEREAAVDLTVTVDYGESIPRVADELRENVSRRIEGITGLSVTEVNVTVSDLYFPGDDEDQESEPPRVQ